MRYYILKQLLCKSGDFCIFITAGFQYEIFFQNTVLPCFGFWLVIGQTSSYVLTSDQVTMPDKKIKIERERDRETWKECQVRVKVPPILSDWTRICQVSISLVGLLKMPFIKVQKREPLLTYLDYQISHNFRIGFVSLKIGLTRTKYRKLFLTVLVHKPNQRYKNLFYCQHCLTYILILSG